MPSKMDHVADAATGGLELYRLGQLHQFPDFVKTASFDKNFQIPPTSAATIFADPVRRQFPCHTKASAYLSYLFYQEKQAEFHPSDREQIERRFEGLAAYWKLKSHFDGIRTKYAAMTKTAGETLPDSAYAYVWVDDKGHKERRLPLRSAAEVKAAADWLFDFRDRLPFAHRHAIATKVMTKAAAYGAGLGDKGEFIERQAGRGVCSPQEVVRMIEDRAKLATDVTLRSHFMKLAGCVKDSPRKALAPAMMVKLAETLDQLDRNLGIAGKYTDGLPRPEDVIFKATFAKVAAESATLVPLTSGKVYDKTAFSKLALADVEALFGTDFAERVKSPLGDVDAEKLAEEVQTLPRPDAALFDGLMSDNGITPSLTKAASARQGLTASEQEYWAKAYAQ